MPKACAPQREKPLQWEARALQWRVAPTRCKERKTECSNDNPAQPQINKGDVVHIYSGILLSHKWHFIFYAQKMESGIFCNLPVVDYLQAHLADVGWWPITYPWVRELQGDSTCSGSSHILSHSCIRSLFSSMMKDTSFSFRTPWHKGRRQWELTQVQLMLVDSNWSLFSPAFYLPSILNCLLCLQTSGSTLKYEMTASQDTV